MNQEIEQGVTETVEVTSIHNNVAQEVIRITVDRLRLVLSQHLNHLEKRQQWIAPLGTLLALLLAFATTTFREFFFPAATWEAFFLIATLACIIWLICTVYSAWKAGSIEDIVELLKRTK